MSEVADKTFYLIGKSIMESSIESFFKLKNRTNEFTDISSKTVEGSTNLQLLIGGFEIPSQEEKSIDSVIKYCNIQENLVFDIESGMSRIVYSELRKKAEEYYDEIMAGTDDFSEFSSDFIKKNPQYLPILMHIAGVTSKAQLKKEVGSVSDNSISKPASERMSKILNQADTSQISRVQILQKLESTLEGIVRDLCGRILLEAIVKKSLEDEKVEFEREEEYESIPGVVYDFRADFVIPDSKETLAFIEVRKSSSRHASLYAKDKMFSAVNWKGNNKKLIAVLIYYGEWTKETLKIMKKVYDYVVPLSDSDKIAKIISEYVNGDVTKLKYKITFKIEEVEEE